MRQFIRGVTLVAGLALVSLGAVACGDDDTTPTAPGTTTAVGTVTAAATTAAATGATATGPPTVRVADNSFSPGTLTVSRGTTVKWDWMGTSAPHSVVGTFNGVEVKSQTITGNGEFSQRFDAAGAFDYVCGVHGAAMPGKIVVQ